MYGDAPLPSQTLVQALERIWNLRAQQVVYKRLGFGAYHWRCATPDGAQWFITADPVDAGTPVVQAYELVRTMADDGLELVRAPLRHRHGGVTHALDGWWISVWPWIDGRSSHSGEHATPCDMEATLRSVRRLHDYTDVSPIPELVEDWAIHDREALIETLRAIHRKGRAGPYADEVRTRLLADKRRIEGSLARYDELTKSILGSSVDLVITHGEPHAANVVQTSAGAVLIDWDTVRWAPKERDLWMLMHPEGIQRAYGDVYVFENALEAYRLQWSLTEIATYVAPLLHASSRTDDLDAAAVDLRTYLVDSPGERPF